MRWCLLLLAALTACEDELPADIDPFPIEVDTADGLSLRAAAPEFGPADVLVDTLTPFSVIDSFRPAPGAEVPDPQRRRMTVDVLSVADVTRARFRDAEVLDMHPCRFPEHLCRVGLEPTADLACSQAPTGADTTDYQGIIGGDLLSLVAMRIDLLDDAAPTLQFFPDIAGDDAYFCKSGSAVIDTPLAGGATIAIEGGEVSYGASRLPLSVCLEYDPTDDAAPSGADALLLLATGLGPSVISETGYRRYLQSVDTAPATLGVQCLHLPSGPTLAEVVEIDRLAIAGDAGDVRGPCEERRAARLMRDGTGCTEGVECPCEDENDERCRAAAVVELEPGVPIQVAVLPDSHPMLQGLRQELRPGQAEVDGLLGMNAFASVRIDIDYPGQRILYRCGDARCRVFTEVFDENGGNTGDRCPDPP